MGYRKAHEYRANRNNTLTSISIQISVSRVMVSELFEKKAKEANELPIKPNTDELLKLYALYKQATVGDNDKERPSIFNMRDRYKWDAWEEQKGKSKDDAEKEYIEFVEELKKKYSGKE